MGEVDVRASVDEPQNFLFRGRIEDYPQPGDVPFGNVDFDGMIILIDFLDADGNQLRYSDRSYAVPPPKKKPTPKGKMPTPKSTLTSYPEPPPTAENPRLEIVIKSVEFESPVIISWPPKCHSQILSAEDATPQTRDDEKIYVQDVLGRFAARAFRRPVSADELRVMIEFFEAIRSDSSSFKEAMRETLAAVLVSPHFLLHR